MRRITVLLSAATFAMTTAFAFAQAPSFAGTWTREAPAANAAGPFGGRGGGRGGFGQDVTITQTATAITMEYALGPNTVTRTFALDGSESRNSMMGRGGAMTEQVSTVVWEGSTLVITTAGANGETRQVLSMSGADLKVDQTAPGRGGGEPTTTTIIYKKAT